MRRQIGRRGAVSMIAAGLLLAGARGAFAQTGTISGSVLYRERMMLPPGARVHVRLEDVSRADAPAIVLSEASFPARTSPTAFALTYDPAALDARRRYALRAAIRLGDELLFTSTDHIAFDPARADGIEILVRRVQAEAAPELPLQGSWLAEDILGGGVIDYLQTTLEVGADGKVHGNGGCNRYTGSAEIEGDKIRFGMLASTERACPPAVMDQEHKLHQALTRTRSFRTDAQTRKLFLLDYTGRTVVSFSAN